MALGIKSKVKYIFSISLACIAVSLASLSYFNYKLNKSSAQLELLMTQKRFIESMSRMCLQNAVYVQSKTDQSFNIYNINLEITPRTKLLYDIIEIMEKGGTLEFDGEAHEYKKLDDNYLAETNKMRLLTNAFFYVNGKVMDIKTQDKDDKLQLLSNVIGQLSDKNMIIMKGIKKNNDIDRNLMSISLIVMVGIVLVTFILFIVSIANNAFNILNIFSGVFTSLSVGDLASLRVESKQQKDFADFYHRFDEFIRRLREIIRAIKEMADNLAAASPQMSSTTLAFTENAQNQAASAEEITGTVEEVSAGMETISTGSQEQFKSLSSLMVRIQDLSGVIDDMDAKIRNTMSLIHKITSEAKSGDESLGSMNESIKKIDSSSKEMMNIVSIINDISEKINLLALNAAIEAARAGDAGRGFAVVSDEISKLADQTASSLSEIDSLIKENEREIGRGMSKVQNTVTIISSIITGIALIDEQMALVSSSMQEQLNKNQLVNSDATAVKKRSEEIKNATDEQKLAFDEIVKSISSINELTQSNASGAEEMSSNSDAVQNMADNLRSKVEFFKI